MWKHWHYGMLEEWTKSWCNFVSVVKKKKKNSFLVENVFFFCFVLGWTWQGSCSTHLENLTQLVLSPHLIPDRLCWSCNVRIRTRAGILLLLHRFALVQRRVCGQLCTPLFLWWSCTLSPRGKVTYSHSNSYSCLFCCWSIGQQWGRAGMKRC